LFTPTSVGSGCWIASSVIFRSQFFPTLLSKVVLHVRFRTHFRPSRPGQCADIVLSLPLRRAHVLFIVDSRRWCTASNFLCEFCVWSELYCAGAIRCLARSFFSLTYRAEAAVPLAWASISILPIARRPPCLALGLPLPIARRPPCLAPGHSEFPIV